MLLYCGIKPPHFFSYRIHTKAAIQSPAQSTIKCKYDPNPIGLSPSGFRVMILSLQNKLSITGKMFIGRAAVCLAFVFFRLKHTFPIMFSIYPIDLLV